MKESAEGERGKREVREAARPVPPVPSRASDKPDASPASACQGEVSVIYDTRVVTVFAAARSGAAQGAGTCKRLEERRALASRGGTSPRAAVTPFLRPSPDRQTHSAPGWG